METIELKVGLPERVVVKLEAYARLTGQPTELILGAALEQFFASKSSQATAMEVRDATDAYRSRKAVVDR